MRTLERGRGVNEILEALGVLARERVNEGSTDPNLPFHTVSTLDFSALGPWISDPVGALGTHYGWGAGGFDGDDLLRRLGAFLSSLGATAVLDDTGPLPVLDFMLAAIRPRTDLSPPGLGVELRQSFPPKVVDLGVPDLDVEIDVQASLPFGLGLTVRPPFDLTLVLPSGTPSLTGEVVLRIVADRTDAAEKFVILGEADASRLEFGRLGLETGLRFTGDGVVPSFRVEAGDGLVRISMADADGFLATILGGVELESTFDLAAGLRTEGGLFFEGSATLEIQLPSHLDLGPVQISAFTISVGVDGGSFPVGLAADITATLGPLVAVVQQVGLNAVFALTDGGGGNAGPVDIALAFKPPTGVGLSLDAGVVSGGGFLVLRHRPRRVRRHPRSSTCSRSCRSRRSA